MMEYHLPQESGKAVFGKDIDQTSDICEQLSCFTLWRYSYPRKKKIKGRNHQHSVISWTNPLLKKDEL